MNDLLVLPGPTLADAALVLLLGVLDLEVE